ncbi:MAG: acyl-CoA desaturase [Gemmataceae bacterium]
MSAALDKLETHPHQPLDPPTNVQNQSVHWVYATGVLAIHLLATLAFVPWFFSWAGVAVALLGCYVFGTLGINLCYHRLLTHRGFRCPRWLEHGLAILGVCCLQDTPAHWVAVHRMHHRFSDQYPDPHSPLANFFWGHMGWLLVQNKNLERMELYERYVKDLLRDRFYLTLERGANWIWVNLAQWAVFYLTGFGIGYALSGQIMSGVQLGLSLLIWGVFLRTVLVWHITWSVNSVAHLWGYRNYETNEGSRNNIFVGLISNGEGWHNNHHAFPRSAAHGHRWWEFDVTYITIRALAMLGLAKDVVLPKVLERHHGVNSETHITFTKVSIEDVTAETTKLTTADFPETEEQAELPAAS